MVSRIPMDQPIDAHLDLGLPGHVAERVDPLAIFQRFFYAHVSLYPADYSLSTAPALECGPTPPMSGAVRRPLDWLVGRSRYAEEAASPG